MKTNWTEGLLRMLLSQMWTIHQRYLMWVNLMNLALVVNEIFINAQRNF
jgi:hypothetical protein